MERKKYKEIERGEEMINTKRKTAIILVMAILIMLMPIAVNAATNIDNQDLSGAEIRIKAYEENWWINYITIDPFKLDEGWDTQVLLPTVNKPSTLTKHVYYNLCKDKEVEKDFFCCL